MQQTHPTAVYRYVTSRRFLDAFFNEGRLRLTSLRTFRNYPDEQRGDSKEGSVDIAHTDEHGNSFRIVTSIGHDVLVFCTSTVLSAEIAKAFRAEACIKIFDLPSFAKAVSACVPDMQACWGGHCEYADAHSVARNTKTNLGPLMISGDGSLSVGNAHQMAYTMQMVTNDLLFRKHSRFRSQSEYRFAWRLTRNANEHEEVICHEARKFCEPVSLQVD